MPAAASTEINTDNRLTRHAWGSLAHSCHRDRVGGSLHEPCHTHSLRAQQRGETWRFPRNLSVSQERGSEGGVPPHPASLMLIACARALRARGDAARPCRVRMRPGKRPRLPTCCTRAAVHGAHGGACVDGDNALMALMARPRALDDSNAVQASRAPLSHALRDAAHVVPRLAARRAPSLRMWRP